MHLPPDQFHGCPLATPPRNARVTWVGWTPEAQRERRHIIAAGAGCYAVSWHRAGFQVLTIHPTT